MNGDGVNNTSETLGFFAENLGKSSKTREDVKTWFEAGEFDDYVSFVNFISRKETKNKTEEKI